MAGFTYLHYKIARHKWKAKALLDENGEISYEMRSILSALTEAHANWDDKLAAFYALELHAAVNDCLGRLGREGEQN